MGGKLSVSIEQAPNSRLSYFVCYYRPDKMLGGGTALLGDERGPPWRAFPACVSNNSL